jgi:oxygen-independent coproporphyrinogen-3 oxidase
MAGIYIHIPFCKKACYYCNFHFSTSQQFKQPLLKSIEQEILLQKTYLSQIIETIYFGGGTPSLCTKKELQTLMKTIKENFIIHQNVEITIETNPDDITEKNLQDWKAIGINRLSIGIQSFDEADLVWMNRAHNSIQAFDALQLAVQYFNNISIDLIYGTPTLSNEAWLKNLSIVQSLAINHLSCYALTVEPNTALNTMIHLQKKENIDTDKQATQFDMLCQWASDNEFEHYEISNFAKPNYRSQHNGNYWKGKPYLGLGPSAHSYNGIARKWNIANNSLYIKSIEQNIIPFEEEILTEIQQLNEFIMIALRTKEGICFLDDRWKMMDYTFKHKILKATEKWRFNNTLIVTENNIYLTDKGKFLADGIAADLFV